jgi:hypothetical protein
MGLPVRLASAHSNLNKAFINDNPKMFREAEIKGTIMAETGISQIGTFPLLKALL